MRQVRHLELHSELFHAGKNHGKKLSLWDDRTQKWREDSQLTWDEKNKRFEFIWAKRKMYIPESSAMGWELDEGPRPEMPNNAHQTHDITKIADAQVSTPHGHVFAGPGKGKIRQ